MYHYHKVVAIIRFLSSFFCLDFVTRSCKSKEREGGREGEGEIKRKRGGKRGRESRRIK